MFMWINMYEDLESSPPPAYKFIDDMYNMTLEKKLAICQEALIQGVTIDNFYCSLDGSLTKWEKYKREYLNYQESKGYIPPTFDFDVERFRFMFEYKLGYISTSRASKVKEDLETMFKRMYCSNIDLAEEKYKIVLEDPSHDFDIVDIWSKQGISYNIDANHFVEADTQSAKLAAALAEYKVLPRGYWERVPELYVSGTGTNNMTKCIDNIGKFNDTTRYMAGALLCMFTDGKIVNNMGRYLYYRKWYMEDNPELIAKCSKIIAKSLLK